MVKATFTVQDLPSSNAEDGLLTEINNEGRSTDAACQDKHDDKNLHNEDHGHKYDTGLTCSLNRGRVGQSLKRRERWLCRCCIDSGSEQELPLSMGNHSYYAVHVQCTYQ